MLVLSLAAVLVLIIAVLALLSAAGRLPFGGTAETVSAAASDRAIFRQQMAELEKMRQRGLLDTDSAAEARLELARRILSAEKQLRDEADGQRPRSLGFRLFLSAAVLCIPLFCAAVYGYQGRPDAPSRPFAAFMARDPAGMTAAEKTVRLEALAARQPQNGRYADELAAQYLQAGRFQDAANAYNHALALNGENADRLLGYALALTGFEDGVVGKQAEAAFRNVLRVDPQNSQAQLFLARGLLQSGKKDAAIALLQQFLQQTPQNSPWRQDLTAAIAALKTGAAPPNAAQARGQAAALTPEQRDFIAANLGRLEARLKAEPQALQAREMLLNAYLLLGEREKAQAALAAGLAVLPPPGAQQLKTFAAQKGLALPAQ